MRLEREKATRRWARASLNFRTMWRNWSGELECHPTREVHPASVEEVRHALRVAQATGVKVRVAGAGHSFSDLVLTNGTLLVLDRMNRVLDVDVPGQRVRVEAGIRLHALSARLAAHGLALPNLGDIDVQSVAGALSTGTHGTGARLPNISAQVEAMELVTADGTLVRCSASDGNLDLFRAARVALGSLGVIVSVTLRCLPAFNLSAVEGPVALETLLGQLESWTAENEHAEFFVFPHCSEALTRVNNRTDAAAGHRSALFAWADDIFLQNHVLGAVMGLGRSMPGAIPTLNRMVTKLAGSKRRVDRSDRIFATPRLVRFTEMEYALPRAAASTVVRRVLAAIETEKFDVNFPLEVRFVAADDALLSPAHGRDTCYVAVHMYRGMAWEPYFRCVEGIMDSQGGRPHWGKRHFQTAATLRTRYPEWDRFQAVRAQLDPRGLFMTPAMERVLGPVNADVAAG